VNRLRQLLQRIHTAWLRHEIESLAEAIDHEERRHKQHAVRMDYWLQLIAQKKGELAALERPPVRLAQIPAGVSLSREVPAIARRALRHPATRI
jgi:hypothetical protein